MLTKKSAIATAKSFINVLINQGIPLDRAVLFGSYSSNNQRQNSDIDIALFSSVFTGVGFEDKKLIAKWNILPEYIDIDVKTFSINDEDPFVEVIEDTGIAIYEK
jgi:predicted nucleotidyltransferase